jgi:hypothetical protein
MDGILGKVETNKDSKDGEKLFTNTFLLFIAKKAASIQN